ncbi:MAG: peptide chain release factor 2 [Acidimicrobiia bacterium]
MRDFSDALGDLARRVRDAHGYLRVDDALKRREELELEASKPDLWDDAEAARKINTELARVIEDIETVEGFEERVSDLETLHELAREADDVAFEHEIEAGIAETEQLLHQVELRALFVGDHDERDAICEVHSGAGGVDAQDWAQMLLRMFSRWAERRGFDVEIVEIQQGQEAGISSATFQVKGRYAYGMLSGEKGVHRLVRISPFDSQSRRHTAFAGLEVVPALEEAEVPEIDATDLRVDVYRSSGAGGQHVNTTDSAVRITHLPSGIVVSCQNERSQIQNRARAMQVLAARLAERERIERQKELEAISGEKRDVAWGSQLRSYVLAPYQLVKDERTRIVDGKEEPIFETGNVSAVLDGEIDGFIEAYLQWRRAALDQRKV